MNIEIKAPSLGESESEATLVQWLKKEGEGVEIDEVLAEIESDKITLEVMSSETGVLLKVYKADGDTVVPGEVIALIDSEARAETKPEKPTIPTVAPSLKAENKQTSQAKKTSASHACDAQSITEQPMLESPSAERHEQRIAMPALRKRIAKRLKEVQNTAAILTTFNEVDLQAVFDVRSRYRKKFEQQKEVDLGLMSFFVHACVQALRQYPMLNASIDGDEIIQRNYCDMGIAVSTEKGLMVPVLRDADRLSFADIEKGIRRLAEQARSAHLQPGDLRGGSFSITNGGVFGSLLSTPILNPPQSAILGMHTIQRRPIALGEQVVIRPMMYLALSYDHRLIDGREAILFLRAVKEQLEFPGQSLLDLA